MSTPVSENPPAQDTCKPSVPVIVAFGVYVALVFALLLALLLKFWPREVPLEKAEIETWWGLFPPRPLSNELRYILLVAISGGLGSYVHLATSFVDYVGNRKFVMNWTWWYLLRPSIGSTLAIIVYFTFRGGLVTGQSGAEQLSPYGVAAIASLAGMFSKQATDKLREIFDNIFQTKAAVERGDPLKD